MDVVGKVLASEAARALNLFLICLCRIGFVLGLFGFVALPYKQAMTSLLAALMCATVAGCYDLWNSPWRSSLKRLCRGDWEQTAAIAVSAIGVGLAAGLLTYLLSGLFSV